MIKFNNLLLGKINIFNDNIIAKAINIVIILIIGFLALKIIPAIIKRTFKRNKINMSERKVKTLSSICVSLSKYCIDFIIIFSLLTTMGIPPNSILAVFGVFTVAIGLGAQNFVKDIINGFLILLEDQMGIGDYVSIDPRSGVVENMGLRTTTLRAIDGSVHIIPNSEIKIITNMSKGYTRAVLDVTVPYSADTDKVIGILKNEMALQKENYEQIINEPVVLGINKMGGGNLEIRIIADCKIGERENIERELRRCIKIRLEKENIL